MEIKTLAQIVADNPQKSNHSERSSKHKNIKPNQNNAKDNLLAKSCSANSYKSTKKINESSVPKTNWHNKHQALSNLTSSHQKSSSKTTTKTTTTTHSNFNKRLSNKLKYKKSFHPASPYQLKTNLKATLNKASKEVDANSIKHLLAQVKNQTNEYSSNYDDSTYQHNGSGGETSVNRLTANLEHSPSDIDNLPRALKAYLKTPEQRKAEVEEIKANSRLRWLAFYYLSRREHSAKELKHKLLEKDQDPKKIDELLVEFSKKGYQSDHRTALMLIREGIRKRRGRVRIKNDFYKRKIKLPCNIDELIDMEMDDNEEFADVTSADSLVHGIDWLRLAVEARVKKYGDDIPQEPKEKARQLRFLQYRGFKPDICFSAIKYNLQTLDERF